MIKLFDNITLERWCEVTLKIGVNLQKGQGLEIVCPVEKSVVAEALTKKAYEFGASIVRVRWNCDKTDRLNYLYADKSALCDIPKWFVDSKNDLVERDFCYLAITCEDPNCFDGVSPQTLGAVNQAKSKALRKYFNAVTSNKIRWCVASVPDKAWAKTVFPNTENAEELLTDAIAKTMRIDNENPLKEWEAHVSILQKHADYLNKMDFEYLHFTNGLGTDLKVGLCKNHVWQSAKEHAQDGLDFIANLPTEEIFTAPHKDKVDGVVYSAKPLIFNGCLIDQFSLTFKKGKVVKYSAKVGYDNLTALLSLDKGMLRLGEVALIGKNSPIAKSGILFYNTLFDENASCHLALGKSYPTTIKEGESLTLKELKQLGANDSIEHEDFMIGTPDLTVTGITKDGKSLTLFVDGEWTI